MNSLLFCWAQNRIVSTLLRTRCAQSPNNPKRSPPLHGIPPFRVGIDRVGDLDRPRACYWRLPQPIAAFCPPRFRLRDHSGIRLLANRDGTIPPHFRVKQARRLDRWHQPGISRHRQHGAAHRISLHRFWQPGSGSAVQRIASVSQAENCVSASLTNSDLDSQTTEPPAPVVFLFAHTQGA